MNKKPETTKGEHTDDKFKALSERLDRIDKRHERTNEVLRDLVKTLIENDPWREMLDVMREYIKAEKKWAFCMYWVLGVLVFLTLLELLAI